MHEENKVDSETHAVLMLNATGKVWDFLEEKGLSEEALAGKQVFFIVEMPDKSCRRLGIGSLLEEICKASEEGQAYEVRYLEVIVRESDEKNHAASRWDNAEYPVGRLPPRLPRLSKNPTWPYGLSPLGEKPAPPEDKAPREHPGR